MIAVLHIIQYEIFEVYDELETFWSLNTPQTIKDIRGHHFFKPVSETHMAISIINPFMPNYVCTSNTVKLCVKSNNKTKQRSQQKELGIGQKYHTTPQGHTRGY